MILSPDGALVRWTLAWVGLALMSVPVIAIRPLLPVLGIGLLASVLADAFLARREPAIGLERQVPEQGAREKQAEIMLRIRNPSPRRIELELRESVPRDLVRPEPAWLDLRVEAGGERRIRYAVLPRVRGRRVFGPLLAQVRSPLGLLRRRVEAGDGDAIQVQPETERFLRPEALDPRTVLASLGVRPKRRRGEGLEFDSLREYVPGDEPRRIDWRATARRGRPIVRTHRHEESRTVILAVDCSRLMGTRAPRASWGAGEADAGFASTKLDHAVDAALALAFAGLVAGDRVGLALFDHGLRAQVTPVADRSSLGLFVDALSTVQTRPVEADYRRLTRELLARQRKRAMIIVLTDFIEVADEELVAPMALLARQHEVVFVALREPILEQLDAVDGEVGVEGEPVDASRRLLPIHRRIVLADLLREREGRLVHLRRRGLSVLDVPPAEATAATLNRYLELRYGVG
jgi:uncharacterized protein (DUF58 family)